MLPTLYFFYLEDDRCAAWSVVSRHMIRYFTNLKEVLLLTRPPAKQTISLRQPKKRKHDNMPCVSEILVICPHDTSYLYIQHLQGNIEQRSCWRPMLIIPGWKINMKQPPFLCLAPTNAWSN